MNNHYFRKISVVTFNSKKFQVFKDEKNRYAFLEIDKDNKFRYPTLEDFIGLANIFAKDLDKEVYFRSTKNNDTKYYFKSFVCLTSGIIALSSALYFGLKSQNVFTNDKVNEVISFSDNYEAEQLKQDNASNEVTFEIVQEKDEPKVVVTLPEEPLEVKEETQENTYVRSKVVTDDMYGIYGSQVDIYDSTALNKFLGEKDITINDINSAVDNNTNLNDDLKSVIKEFAQTMMTTYPSIDMRLFYENVKRLSVVYETQEAIDDHGDMIAWFNYEYGQIHVNENINLSPGSYDLMVLRHEICHMISLGFLYENDQKIVCITKNGGYGEYLQEAIDVYLSSKPYENEYNFTDFGYGTCANELEVIIDAIPNFDISVLANQDVYNIANYLDKVNPNDVSASRFIDLMDMQTIAFYNMNNLQVENTEFKDLYRYIANTYLNYVVTPDMSAEEIENIKNNLVNELNRNLGYSVNVTYYDEITNTFNEYMEKNNIEQNYKTK